MAGRKDKTHGKQNIQAKSMSMNDQASITKSSGTKHKLTDGMDKSKEHPAKRSKARSTQEFPAIHRSRQFVKVNKPKNIPQASMDGNVDASGQRAGKRPREGDVENNLHLQNKRAKPNEDDGSNDRSQTVHPADQNTTEDVTAADPEIPSETLGQALPVEVQHLVQKFDFSTMSILSSSKIESRVRNLLDKVGRFSFATPGAKPGVVLLSAKAEIASKMGSIVEIAKQKIQEERGKWWQYNKVERELSELKPKQSKRTGGGRTLEEWSKDQGPNATTESKAANNPEHPAMGGMGDRDTVDEEGDIDMEEEFETMTNLKVRDSKSRMLESGIQKKVRQKARMTIVFARVPITDLKGLYDEQTNA